MIAPLRRGHFYIWIALAILMSTLLTAGFRVRRAASPPNPGLSWEDYR